MKAETKTNKLSKEKRNYKKEFWAARYLYLLALPGFIFILVFNYAPMYGLSLAFKQFNSGLGILKSPFVGLNNFRNVLSDSYFWYVFANTLKISFGRLIFTFPIPIIIALFFNELRNRVLQKTLQTVYTFPHFLSWVVLSGICISILDFNGPINAILSLLGFEKIVFLGEKSLFIPILYISHIWKESGWSSIIYLAAIAGINTEFYEAADLDGANRFQKMWHITLPSIAPTIFMLLILAIGGLMDGGFDQIFNLSNSVVQKKGDILGTYIYRITFLTSGDFSFSTTVGLFTSVINFTLLTIANTISKRVQGVGILEGGK